MCEGLALSVWEINIKTPRYSSHHNCGLSENQGASDWPPAANEMQLSSEEFLLQCFIWFLNLVTARNEDVGSSLVFSTYQNLCRAMSEAEWKVPI